MQQFNGWESLPKDDPTALRVRKAANAIAAKMEADTQRRAKMRVRAEAEKARVAAEKEREDAEMEKGGRSRRRHKKTKRSTKKRRHTRRR